MSKDYSRDFADIEYFIDHVYDIDARIDVLKKLGYRVGVDIVTKDTDKVKKVIVGKRGELRIQIAPAKKGLPIASCVILE